MTDVSTEPQCCFLCGAGEAVVLCSTRDFCYETCSNEFQYVRCAGCGHVYLKNRPSLTAIEVIYPENYLTYDYEAHLGGLINKLRSFVQRAKVAPLRRHAASGDVILDVGCGGGDFLALVQRYGDPSWQLYGVDFSPAAIKQLTQRGQKGIEARFEEMQWDGPPVGAIVMNQLIEHVADPGASIRKSFELLRPGGALIMETPSLDGWDARMFRRRHWGGWHAPRHWNLFTPASLRRCVEAAGFEVAEVKHILSPFSWLHSVQYTLRDRFGLGRIARWSDVDRIVPLCIAGTIDVLQLALTSKTACMRLVARKP